MALAIKKHSGKSDLDASGFNIIVYGLPGAGKTSMCSTFPKVLYIDTENGVKFIDNEMDIATVRNWTEVEEVIQIMQSGASGYQTVVFDVVDEIHSLYMEHLKKTRGDLFNRQGSPTMQGWGAVKEGWRKFCKTMCLESSFNTVFVAHEKITTDDNGNVLTVSPKLMGSAAGELVGFVDFCGFKPDKTCIDFRESATHTSTKDRHGTFASLDSVIYNPTYDMLRGLVKKEFNPLAATLPAKFTSLQHAYDSCAAVGYDKDAVDALMADITAPKKAVELRNIIYNNLTSGQVLSAPPNIPAWQNWESIKDGVAWATTTLGIAEDEVKRILKEDLADVKEGKAEAFFNLLTK
jgi:hypothetical protein